MDHASDKISIEMFAQISGDIAKLLRTFGVPEYVDDNLHAIALWGAEPTRWVSWWKDHIIQMRDDFEIVSVRPWIGHPKLDETEWSGPCAHSCATWLLAHLWSSLFPENPQWVKIPDDVDKYISKHRAELKQRLQFWFQFFNRNDWLKLESRIQNERALLVEEVSTWPILTPDELRTLFSLGQDALVSRLKSQVIRNEPITTKSYRVKPSALPGDWKQKLKRN